jgi:hypothetical protein
MRVDLDSEDHTLCSEALDRREAEIRRLHAELNTLQALYRKAWSERQRFKQQRDSLALRYPRARENMHRDYQHKLKCRRDEVKWWKNAAKKWCRLLREAGVTFDWAKEHHLVSQDGGGPPVGVMIRKLAAERDSIKTSWWRRWLGSPKRSDP